MDFSFNDEQQAVRDLATQIFEGSADADRVRDVEATDDRFDRELWSELAKAGLLGIALPKQHGGAGLGIVELCLVLEQQGRRVAPVPLWPTVALGALAIAEFGEEPLRDAVLPGVVEGALVLTAGLEEPGAGDLLAPGTTAAPAGDDWRLDGTKVSVPAAPLADRIIVSAMAPDGPGLFLCDPTGSGVTIERFETTSRAIAGHVTLEDVPATRLGDSTALGWLLDRAQVTQAAIQVGVCEEAVRMAAAYTSEREQFGKPLSTNQAVALRAADGYIATEAIRATLWQAAWLLDEGRDTGTAALAASWWASEGGHQVLHATQHLHGGMGSDIDYPVHRYFLWGKQIGDTLGGASPQAAWLGARIAQDTKPTEEATT